MIKSQWASRRAEFERRAVALEERGLPREVAADLVDVGDRKLLDAIERLGDEQLVAWGQVRAACSAP